MDTRRYSKVLVNSRWTPYFEVCWRITFTAPYNKKLRSRWRGNNGWNTSKLNRKLSPSKSHRIITLTWNVTWQNVFPRLVKGKARLVDQKHGLAIIFCSQNMFAFSNNSNKRWEIEKKQMQNSLQIQEATPFSDLKVQALSMVGILVNSCSNLEAEARSFSASSMADSNAKFCKCKTKLKSTLKHSTQSGER